MTPEQLVIRHLLSNHSKDGRPIEDPRQSVNVTIQLYLAELLTLVWFETFLALETTLMKRKLLTFLNDWQWKPLVLLHFWWFSGWSLTDYISVCLDWSRKFFFIYILDTVNSKCNENVGCLCSSKACYWFTIDQSFSQTSNYVVIRIRLRFRCLFDLIFHEEIKKSVKHFPVRESPISKCYICEFLIDVAWWHVEMESNRVVQRN